MAQRSDAACGRSLRDNENRTSFLHWQHAPSGRAERLHVCRRHRPHVVAHQEYQATVRVVSGNVLAAAGTVIAASGAVTFSF
ncbi:hypothetical protein [Blastochloris tepida]|uniref:hypothetical protein n=1 Tax=Blastochloris tepida TaxID=2233851 RepID=UPI000F840E12|nr:hypothetical protein [Blastochloris tepida]